LALDQRHFAISQALDDFMMDIRCDLEIGEGSTGRQRRRSSVGPPPRERKEIP